MRILRGLPTALVLTALVVAALASSAAARNLYVPTYEAETVGVLDAATGQVAAPAFTTGAGTGPWTSAVSPDGKTVYVVLYDKDAVQGFDTTTNQPVGPPMPIGDEAYGISITPDGKKAYTANTDDSFISVLDLQAKTALAPITVGDEPYEIAITPDGARAYVACDDGLYIVDLAAGAATGSPIPLDDPTGVAITPDGKLLAVVLSDETTVIVDTATNQVVGAPIPTPHGYIPAIDPTGTRAYVSGLEDSVIYVIDLATRQALAPIALLAGSEPEYVALTPDGKRLFASDYDGEGVIPVDIATGAVAPIVKTGKGAGKFSVVPDQPPTASIAPPAKIRPGVPATLSGAGSTDADGTIVTYAWAFGDGGTATGPASSAAHTYAAPGEYRATLTLTDNEGCSTTFVFTGSTAYCNGSAVATTTATIAVKYPGVKVKCPKSAGPKGCKFKLKAVKKTGKGKKKKLKSQSALARATVKAGKSAIVSLKPDAKSAASLASAEKALVQQSVTIKGEQKTKVTKLKIVE